MQLALVIGVVATLASGCGNTSDPTPTIAPELRTATAVARDATATASAETAYLSRPPCVLDRTTLGVVDAIADALWRLGTDLADSNGSLALEYYEASIAYGLVAECREVGATPIAIASPVASPVACPPGTDEAIARLQDAWAKGSVTVTRLLLVGMAAEDLAPMVAVNQVLIARADALRTACGIAPPGTATPAAR
jgi:hypothetical protein